MTHDKPEVYIYFSSSVNTVDDSNKKGADCELKTVCSLDCLSRTDVRLCDESHLYFSDLTTVSALKKFFEQYACIQLLSAGL